MSFKALISEEVRANGEIARMARDRGPIYAMHLVGRGELGGPLLRAGNRVGAVPANFGSIWKVRLFALLAPVLLGFLILQGTNSLLNSDSTIVQLVLVSALGVLAGVAATLLYALAMRPTRSRILAFVRDWSHEDLVLWGLMVIVVPTVGFAAVTAILVSHQVIDAHGVVTTSPTLAFETFETFVWNLADAVPILKVPQTLHWTPGLELPTVTGGAIILVYKLVLIVPLLQLAAVVLARTFGDEPTGSSEKSAEN